MSLENPQKSTPPNKTGDPNETKFDNEKYERLKQRENRWHEISMNQLSFYNNTLIALGTGFVAYVLKESLQTTITFSWSNIDYRVTAVAFSIIVMIFSVFTGLLCGYNRMVDFRYTHRANTIRRKLYQKNAKHYNVEGKYKDKLQPTLRYWFRDADFFDVEEKEYIDTPEDVKKKIDGCSKLTKKLGKFTRNILRVQIILFFIGIVLFALSFM